MGLSTITATIMILLMSVVGIQDPKQDTNNIPQFRKDFQEAISVLPEARRAECMKLWKEIDTVVLDALRMTRKAHEILQDETKSKSEEEVSRVYEQTERIYTLMWTIEALTHRLDVVYESAIVALGKSPDMKIRQSFWRALGDRKSILQAILADTIYIRGTTTETLKKIREKKQKKPGTKLTTVGKPDTIRISSPPEERAFKIET